jgi:hypothetical protein
MVEQIIVAGRIPSKKNSRMAIPIGKRCVLITQKNYQQWHKQASLLLPKVRIDEILELTILFYFPDARRTDLTNKAESIMDLLVDNGILEDDNYTVVPRLVLATGGIDRLNPRAEITWQKNKNQL